MKESMNNITGIDHLLIKLDSVHSFRVNGKECHYYYQDENKVGFMCGDIPEDDEEIVLDEYSIIVYDGDVITIKEMMPVMSYIIGREDEGTIRYIPKYTTTIRCKSL